jgi:hypothetical protein
MHASNGDVGRRRRLGDGAAGNHSRSAGQERKRLVIEPYAAGLFHGALDQADADAPIVIAADCSDKAPLLSGQYQARQLRQSALPVNEIAAQQEQIGVRSGDDPLQLIAKILGSICP